MALGAKFWKRDIGSTSERPFSGFLGDFFSSSTPSKNRLFQYTSVHSLLVNGVVTASNHTLWRVLSNKVIWVLGQYWVNTQHVHTFEEDSILSKLFALRRHGHAEVTQILSAEALLLNGFGQDPHKPTSTNWCVSNKNGSKLNVLMRDKISFVGVAHLTHGGRSCSWAFYRWF